MQSPEEWRGYVSAKLESIHEDLTRIAETCVSRGMQINNHHACIAGLKTSCKLQWTLSVVTFTAVVGGMIKLIFFN